MFGRTKHKLRREYDEYLLDAIGIATENWNRSKQTLVAVREADDELNAMVELAAAKYEFLYREARRRKVKAHFRASMLESD